TTNDVTRQRSMEQHEAAVRAQRGSINTAVVPTQTRGAVNTSTRSTTVDPVQTRSSTAAPVQTRTVQRPEAVTRTSVPRAQSTAGRSSVQRSTNNTTAVNERSQNTPVSRTVKPTVRETSGTVRSSGRG